MVGEELHVGYFNVRFEAVDFDAGVVVDVGVFLLGNGEELFIVEPPFHRVSNLTDVFVEYELTTDLTSLTVSLS